MINRMERTRLFISLIIVTAVTIVATSPSVNSEQGLQITNPIIEIEADRGKTYTAKTSLLNVTTTDLVYSTLANDFHAKDETGNAEVLLDSFLPASSSMAKWIQPIGSIAIKAKQTKPIEIRIVVTADAEPGGHYGIVRFTGSAPKLNESGVAQIGSTGPLILVRVSGQVKETLDLKEFFTLRGSKRSAWFETGPVTFVERVQNTGNIHVKPVGDLVITNMFGKNIASLKVNDNKSNVLPSSIRRFEQTLKKKWLFGKYSATISLAYGRQGQVLLGSTSFWVIPYKLIIIAVVALAMIILIIRLLIRRYNDKIIKRAMNEQKKQKN